MIEYSEKTLIKALYTSPVYKNSNENQKEILHQFVVAFAKEMEKMKEMGPSAYLCQQDDYFK